MEFVDLQAALADIAAGRLNAFIVWRGLLLPEMSDAFAQGRFRLISLDEDSIRGLRLKYPFLLPYAIPSRTYPHQAASTSTISTRMLLLASKALSSELVDRILTAIAGHLPDLIARHPAAAEIMVKKAPTLEDGMSINLHPGAERFFERTKK